MTLIEQGLKAIKQLQMMDEVYSMFDKEVIYLSEEPNGIMFDITGKQEIEDKIKWIERNENTKVFHVIQGKYKMSDNSFLRLRTYLIITDEEIEDVERFDDNKFIAFTYTENLDNKDFSEYGSCLIEPKNGGLVRRS